MKLTQEERAARFRALHEGPGAFVISARNCTLSLQANALYDTMARDELLAKPSNRTGSTAWYLGPQVVDLQYASLLLVYLHRDILDARTRHALGDKAADTACSNDAYSKPGEVGLLLLHLGADLPRPAVARDLLALRDPLGLHLELPAVGEREHDLGVGLFQDPGRVRDRRVDRGLDAFWIGCAIRHGKHLLPFR